MQALKLGQLPSDIVLPGDDAAKLPTTDAAMEETATIPPSVQQPEETAAMEEVTLIMRCELFPNDITLQFSNTYLSVSSKQG